MIRALVLLGVLALATPAVDALPGDALTLASPGRDTSSPLAAVLNQLNGELCGAAPGMPSRLFDTTEIARRALGRSHRDRTVGELAEFTELIGRRFQQRYRGMLGRIAELRVAAEAADGNWAILLTKMTSGSGRKRDLTYRLHRADDGRWRVYDVETDGRSSLRAFYGEFDRIILNEGYPELVDRIRKDVHRDAGTQPGCATSLTGPDHPPVAAPDRAGADPRARRRGR